LHMLCFKGSKSFAGQFRDVNVVIRDSKGNMVHQGTPIEQLRKALKEYIFWYNCNKKRFKPLVLAAVIHNQFENIHPFQDGNGRVGRLLLNFILLKNRYPPINIHLENRREYYNILQEYRNNHDLKPTLRFLISQYKKSGVTTKNKKH
ncbi:Fic family protein, partial [Candidatus Woesearchaeota archaeon]|nr:Fic family protein [Candidatus Woesearchaeota archaeon]